jgi:hypothetical protein
LKIIGHNIQLPTGKIAFPVLGDMPSHLKLRYKLISIAHTTQAANIFTLLILLLLAKFLQKSAVKLF